MLGRRIADAAGKGQEKGLGEVNTIKYIIHVKLSAHKMIFKLKTNNYINKNAVPQTSYPVNNLTNLTASDLVQITEHLHRSRKFCWTALTWNIRCEPFRPWCTWGWLRVNPTLQPAMCLRRRPWAKFKLAFPVLPTSHPHPSVSHAHQMPYHVDR